MKMQRYANFRYTVGSALLAFGLVVVAGCTININEEDSAEINAALERLNAEVDGLAAKVKEVTIDNREEYAAELDSVLDDIDEELRDLAERAKAGSRDAAAKIDTRIRELDISRETVRERLDALDDASATTWERVKQELGEAATKLDESFEDFRRELKEM